MVRISTKPRLSGEDWKFLNTPLGAFIADQLERGNLEVLDTQARLTAALMGFIRRKKAEYYSVMTAMNKKPTPSLVEAIQRAILPWQAPPLTPEERGLVFSVSSLMGKKLVLDHKEFLSRSGRV